MSLMPQDELGRCDFLDVLEEAVLVKTPVEVKLRSGETFIDVVRDVTTKEGQELVEFHERGRMPLSAVHAVTRAAPPRH
jgi:transcriptional antiterminator Rof (Rho-off)